MFSGSFWFLTGLPHAVRVRSLRLPPRTVLSKRTPLSAVAQFFGGSH